MKNLLLTIVIGTVLWSLLGRGDVLLAQAGGGTSTPAAPTTSSPPPAPGTGTNATNQAANTNATGAAHGAVTNAAPGASTPHAADTNTPAILGIAPGAPLIAPNQPLVLTGSNFQDKVTVKFTDPQDNEWLEAQVLDVKASRLSVVATLGTAGRWKVTAVNSNGASSAPFVFQVANVPGPDNDLRALTFFISAGVVTILIGVLLGVLVAKLSAAEKAGQWSLGNALSEESSYQPKQINQKSDVIMFASSSRLIALLGLMGILTLVIGIGYAVMWNLFIYGTVPDLSQVRAFLYGSACLFAPYLANQLSNVFNPSPKPPQTNQGPAPAPASPTITGLGPASPTAAMAAQSVQITGTNFQAGVTLVLTDPQGRQRPVAPADITDVHPTVFKANLPLDLPGPWKIVVQNPPADASPGFIFTVSGPPTVTALNPAAPVHNAAAQKLTFTGIGFMSGVKVAVTDPNGAVSNTTVTTVTSTSVDVQAILVAVGVWRAVITNPGGQAAGAFQFNVT